LLEKDDLTLTIDEALNPATFLEGETGRKSPIHKCLDIMEYQTKVRPDLRETPFFFFFFYYSYVHTRLGSFLPPAPTPSLTIHSAPSLSPLPPQYPADTILPLFLILL
jgi:hypothetical protein